MGSSTAVALFDPDTYVSGAPHDLLTELRQTEPVVRQPVPDGTECWAVLKHADVVHVAREPMLFSASEGGVVVEELGEEQLTMMRHMLLAMDPPPHADYRRPVAPSFTARVIGQLEDQVRDICRGIMDRAAEAGDVEFAHDVCGLLPSEVVGKIMGLPAEDWPQIQTWAEQMTSNQDPDLNPSGVMDNPSLAMAMYFIEFGAQRRAEPAREDLTSLILAADFGGEPMSDIDFGSFCVQLVTAGNDTTKTMLSSGLHALLQHRDQLAALREDSSLLPGAVEEILRWANPLHYFRRTVMEDTEIRGVGIAAGEKVSMMYTSANRDEDVFGDGQAFDIRRDPNPHLSFGIGEHFCLGAHLARLDGRVFFEELLARFSTIEQTGDAVHTRSNLNNALKAFPVRLA